MSDKSYSLFDLHCDTALRLTHRSLSVSDNEECHISLEKAKYLKNYAQVFAVFTPKPFTDDEGFDNFKKVMEYFEADVKRNGDKISVCTSGAAVKAAISEGKRAAIPAIEDVRILGGDESRIELILSKGVRFVTPVWGGESCIGGAHDTESGLTEFGRLAVKKLAEGHVVHDVSHASEKTADGIFEAAASVGGRVIATHSNSASAFKHTRNLRDRHFEAIKSLGGVVGISLCPPHISDEENPNVDSVIRHIDRYMELGGEDCIAIGADLDGTNLPSGFESIADLYKIADRLSKLGYSRELIDKIFFENAFNFAINNL